MGLREEEGQKMTSQNKATLEGRSKKEEDT